MGTNILKLLTIDWLSQLLQLLRFSKEINNKKIEEEVSDYCKNYGKSYYTSMFVFDFFHY